MPKGYDNADDAAAAALMRINSLPNSDQLEYIGLIYQDPKTGKYMFTDPVSLGAASGKDRAKGVFKVPGGKSSVRGIIHNHPGAMGLSDKHLSYLSPDDVEQAEALGVPSYIGVGQSLMKWTGRVRRGRGLTKEVLARIPIEEISAIIKRRFADSLDQLQKHNENSWKMAATKGQLAKALDTKPTLTDMFTGKK